MGLNGFKEYQRLCTNLRLKLSTFIILNKYCLNTLNIKATQKNLLCFKIIAKTSCASKKNVLTEIKKSFTNWDNEEVVL